MQSNLYLVTFEFVQPYSETSVKTRRYPPTSPLVIPRRCSTYDERCGSNGAIRSSGIPIFKNKKPNGQSILNLNYKSKLYQF